MSIFNKHTCTLYTDTSLVGGGPLPINMCLWWSRLLPIVTVFVYYYYCLAFLAFWLEDVFCSFDHRNVPWPQLTFLAKFFLLYLLYRGVDERELSSWSGLSGWSVTLDINPGPWKLGTATGSFNPGLHPGQPFISPGHTHTHTVLVIVSDTPS